MESNQNLLARHPFWQGADPAHLARLAPLAKLEHYGVGELIFQERHEATHLYLVQHGHVALESFLPGTGVTTIVILGPGEALGWSWLFPPYRWQYSARSVDVTEIITLDAVRLRALVDQDPVFGRDLITRTAKLLEQRLLAERSKLLELQAAQTKPLGDVLGEAEEEPEPFVQSPT